MYKRDNSINCSTLHCGSCCSACKVLLSTTHASLYMYGSDPHVPDPTDHIFPILFPSPSSQSGPVLLMAVPSSFNDLTQEASLRDYVGWVWYERTVTLPPLLAPNGNTTSYWLRFESAHYYTMVVSVRGRREEVSKCCAILAL